VTLKEEILHEQRTTIARIHYYQLLGHRPRVGEALVLGNILGIVYNLHYLEVLSSAQKA
jgi:hypothetical protein